MAFEEAVELRDVRARHVRARLVQRGEGARDLGVGQRTAVWEQFAASG